jgi:hypothetical protein
MFTVEMDTDLGESATITSLDDGGSFPDVEVIIFDDSVTIRQIIDHGKDILVDMVMMSPTQWHEVLSAMQLSEGAYTLGRKEVVND